MYASPAEDLQIANNAEVMDVSPKIVLRDNATNATEPKIITVVKTTADTAPEDSSEGFVYSQDIPLSEDIQEFLYTTCEESGLNYHTILALIWNESRFDQNAIGYNSNGTRDNGLMQINDCNRGWIQRELGITDIMDPYNNITAATTMLSELVGQHGEYYGLMAYKMGEQGMLDSVARGSTSSKYVNALMAKGQEFESVINNSSISEL